VTSAPARGRRLLLAGAMAAVTLAAVELVTRAAFSVDFVFDRLAGHDEASSRLQWVRGRQRGRQFVYRFDVHDPLRGWGVQPGLRDLEVFDGKRLSTSSRGLRGAAERAYEKEPGVTRVVLLGDSYTFGDEVSDDETWAHHLERLLPGTEVLNLGVHGYGLDQALVYLREEGVRYRPDVVLLGFVWFDIHRNLFAFTNYAKPTFAVVDGQLRLGNVPVPHPETVLGREVYRSKALDLGAWRGSGCAG
jgi:hypothetical protein